MVGGSDEGVLEVKKKREFAGLPDSIVSRAVDLSSGDVKVARALLRKYFGVFLTNRVLHFARSQITGHKSQEILEVHISSKKRDYGEFYERIFSVVGDAGSVVDLGCGVNGFSYKYLPNDVSYVGVEAVKQLVDLTNVYFREEDYDGRVVYLDLFDVEGVKGVLKSCKKPRVVFMFQVVDALEGLERNFSKRFISEIAEECEWIVLTLSMESLSGRNKFVVQRKWLLDFLKSNFLIEGDFTSRGERIIILKIK